MYCDWPQLGRCCFCMPLRQGVLTFAYINAIFCTFMIGFYCYSVHYSLGYWPVFHGTSPNESSEFGVFLYCVEFVFSIALIYGAHKKIAVFIKAFYYFAISTTMAMVLVQIYNMTTYNYFYMSVETGLFTFTGTCIQLYLIILVRSLLRKMDLDGPHLYDNPLHQIVTGNIKIESNGIYNNTTTVEPIDS